MILGDFNKHCNCTGSSKIYRVPDSTKRTMPPKFVEPYSSEDVGHFPKKKKQKKTNQLNIAATVPQNFQLFKTLEAKTNMSKTWYIGNQQFTPRPNDSASEIPENIVYKNDACGAITSIVHFLSVY
jgi:hypothetical protein